MAFFPVSEAKDQDLRRRMTRLQITESDLVETFLRGSGPGVQKINQTSGAVLLEHPASGLAIRCQESRSQALNRFLARRLLVEKLEARLFHEKSEAQKRMEKIRRQKRRRSKRAKEKMLADKRHQSLKKSLRRAVDEG